MMHNGSVANLLCLCYLMLHCVYSTNHTGTSSFKMVRVYRRAIQTVVVMVPVQICQGPATVIHTATHGVTAAWILQTSAVLQVPSLVLCKLL